MTWLAVVFNNLVLIAPTIAWIIAIVLTVLMLRQGGGRAEHFLLTGCCLMLASVLLTIPISVIVPMLIESGASNIRTASVVGGYRLFLSLINLAGIVCLVYAYWVKFKVRA
ncbi:MAG: hypothetical protein ABIH70_06065 [Chloroflexota bacterium]